MPEEIDWGAIIEKGLEAAVVSFGESFGGTIGEILAEKIMSSLFESGDEDKFQVVLKDLKESIRQDIDKAFLREHCGAVTGLGENLKTYFHTKDQNILNLLQNDITKEIDTLFLFESLEALTALVYGVNIYIHTLRALADYDKDYYRVAMDKARNYADKVEKFANKVDQPIRSSIPDKIDVYGLRTKETICQNNLAGVEYEVTATYTDSIGPVVVIRRENMCVSYRVDASGRPDRNMSHPQSIFEQSQSSKVVEEIRRTQKENRIQALDNLIVPTQHAIEKWRNIADVINAKL
ncbi:hypothetical protein [Bacillus cereus]|uniref:hypothetical protein n=1 Tax=Bacillus cereus TaxID=1396 RepID=UPI0014193DE1|nr:hypothetical protein [Bacillus cereus]